MVNGRWGRGSKSPYNYLRIAIPLFSIQVSLLSSLLLITSVVGPVRSVAGLLVRSVVPGAWPGSLAGSVVAAPVVFLADPSSPAAVPEAYSQCQGVNLAALLAVRPGLAVVAFEPVVGLLCPVVDLRRL